MKNVNKQKPHAVFCPFCNARGSPQPVLSPMIVSEIQITTDAPGSKAVWSYRCQRCSYGEIHDVPGAQ